MSEIFSIIRQALCGIGLVTAILAVPVSIGTYRYDENLKTDPINWDERSNQYPHARFGIDRLNHFRIRVPFSRAKLGKI